MFFAQFSPDQLRAGYARNAQGLAQMLTRAERTKRKVNGYTADQLRVFVARYQVLSVADDATLRAHLSATPRKGKD